MQNTVPEALLEIALGFQPKDRKPPPKNTSRSDGLWTGHHSNSNDKPTLSLRDIVIEGNLTMG